MKVLAIDDDKDFLNLLGLHLKRVGYTTQLVSDTESILQTLTNDTYDLILVDWMMPDIDGITVVRAIRNLDRKTGNATKIIMVTAINNTLAKQYAKRSGADGFLAKDLDGKKFQTRLYEIIREVMDLAEEPEAGIK